MSLILFVVTKSVMYIHCYCGQPDGLSFEPVCVHIALILKSVI